MLLLLVGLVATWLMLDRLVPPEVHEAASADVRDGDTLIVAGNRVRLYGIDAPEYHQSCRDAAGKLWPCGLQARTRLVDLTKAGPISCTVRATDQYDRKVAQCTNGSDVDLARAMVESGFAISPASRGTAAYAEEEAQAQQAKRGIWQGTFETPATWRSAHPRGVRE